MPALKLPRFCDPDVFRKVHPTRLSAFLEPYQEFLAAAEFALPITGDPDEIDYDPLVQFLLKADEDYPKDLIDALYLVNEMATPSGMDSLLFAADQAGLTLDTNEESTEADIAVAVWLADRSLLEAKHAEQYLYRARSFESFHARSSPRGEIVVPNKEQRLDLEQQLDAWFDRKNRGRGTRLFFFPQEDSLWILVRHGDPFKREESLRHRKSSSVCYRPLKYDVLVYLPEAGELRINARSKSEKYRYRELFGGLFLGGDSFSCSRPKYTLEPLRLQREDALVCVDVKGIESVVLRELQFQWEETPPSTQTFRAKDLFGCVRFLNSDALKLAKLERAQFEILFTGAKRTRHVTLRAGNVAAYARDSDVDVIEGWLRKRGFLQRTNREEAGREAVAGA